MPPLRLSVLSVWLRFKLFFIGLRKWWFVWRPQSPMKAEIASRIARVETVLDDLEWFEAAFQNGRPVAPTAAYAEWCRCVADDACAARSAIAKVLDAIGKKP